MPLSIFLTGTYQVLSYWANRKKIYGKMASSRIIQSVSTAIASLLLGILGYDYNGLVFGYILGQAASIIPLAKIITGEYHYFFTNLSRNSMLFNAKKYRDLPQNNSLRAFWITVE
jgi:hypothetical protein